MNKKEQLEFEKRFGRLIDKCGGINDIEII